MEAGTLPKITDIPEEEDDLKKLRQFSTKTCLETKFLDLKILSRQGPILGLDSPSLEFLDQDQESH